MKFSWKKVKSNLLIIALRELARIIARFVDAFILDALVAHYISLFYIIAAYYRRRLQIQNSREHKWANSEHSWALRDESRSTSTGNHSQRYNVAILDSRSITARDMAAQLRRLRTFAPRRHFAVTYERIENRSASARESKRAARENSRRPQTQRDAKRRTGNGDGESRVDGRKVSSLRKIPSAQDEVVSQTHRHVRIHPIVCRSIKHSSQYTVIRQDTISRCSKHRAS